MLRVPKKLKGREGERERGRERESESERERERKGGNAKQTAPSLPKMKQRKRSSYGRKTRQPKQVSALAAGGAPAGAKAVDHVDEEKQNPAAQKQQICVDILTSGHVQSFVDFFYLMHRPEPNPDPNKPEDADAEIEVPTEQMLMVRDNLTSAEAARREGDTSKVYANYSELARGYQESNDAKTGIYFFEKCLEIARLTNDVIGEMHANHDLGLAYQRLENIEMAIEYHSLHRELAVRNSEGFANGDDNAPDAGKLEGEIRTASHELNKMYRKKAEQLESQEKLGDAIELYRLGLTAAQDTADAETIGQANYRLGRALILVDDPKAAIDYLNVYLENSISNGNVAAQGQAYSALAAAHQALSSTEDAVSCLQQYLKIAKKTDNLTAQAEACCNLGVIHNRRGEYKKAVHFFGK